MFLPETIGSINWLSKNKSSVNNIIGGFVLTCVGDDNNINFKKSRNENSLINKAAKYLKNSNQKFNIIEYFPMGSDERQYCSPGFDLPIATIMRSLPGKFKEYHTSLDNLSFIKESKIEGVVNFCKLLICVIEKNLTLKNTVMFCEPQLGRRGLYRSFGGQKFNSSNHQAVKWILNYSDGNNDLISISKKSNIDLRELFKVSQILVEKDLVRIL